MILNAIKFLILILTIIGFAIGNSPISNAASQDACAIWLCLPAGFPGSECSPAHSEFKHRIKKGKSPLPNLADCSTGPNGEKTNGGYTLGYEVFEPCKQGYTLKTVSRGYGRANQTGICYADACASIFTPIFNDYRCNNYVATPRPKPSFVKMWVDGSYLGQFFY